MATFIPEIIGFVLLLWYLSHQAGRLDRLHNRIAISRGSLDANLARRAGVVAEISALPYLDLASSSVLAEAAHDALTVDPNVYEMRVQTENELTATLIEVFGDPEEVSHLRLDPATAGLLGELAAVVKQVQLSRRFHADAVNAVLAIRRQRLVRFFHLAGRAALPQTFDFDDRMPSGLVA